MVLDRALDALIAQCEKRKFGATATPRSAHRPTAAPRHVPAHVKRSVWLGDQGRCTFGGDRGHRCGSRRYLEFDHVDPVARGGRATAENTRLRCHAHNQHEAERTFGPAFMSEKREEARRAAARGQAMAAARAAEESRARTEMREQANEVVSALRQLGCRPDEARPAAEHAVALGESTIEERLRAALRFLRPPRSTVVTQRPCASWDSSARPEPVSMGV